MVAGLRDGPVDRFSSRPHLFNTDSNCFFCPKEREKTNYKRTRERKEVELERNGKRKAPFEQRNITVSMSDSEDEH